MRYTHETTFSPLAASWLRRRHPWRHLTALPIGWTGGSPLIAPFYSINESTWDHMKLLFWPMFFFSLFQYPFFKDRKNFWCIKLFGIILGLLLIPVLFYTYNGVFDPSVHRINIRIFYISATATFLVEELLFKQDRISCRYAWLAFTVIMLIAGLFIMFTFVPPEMLGFRET